MSVNSESMSSFVVLFVSSLVNSFILFRTMSLIGLILRALCKRLRLNFDRLNKDLSADLACVLR